MAVQPKPRPRVPRPRTSSEPEVSLHPSPPRSNSEDSGLPPGAPVPKPRACWTTSTTASNTQQSVPPLTSRAESIPESELYGDDGPVAESTAESSVFPEQEPALKTQVERLRKVIAALREEERSLNLSTEQKQRELEELDTRVRRLTSEEVALNTKLTRLHEREREQEEKRSDGRMEERLRERELAVQHREDRVSDRESANRQESLRLQRLADQLHMQKKDLEHREFDLQTYHDEGDRPGGHERAQLAERERVVQRMEADLRGREQALEEMRANFDGWKRQQEQSLLQRWSQLEQREESQQSRMTGYQPAAPYPPYQQPAPQATARPPFVPHSALQPQPLPYPTTFTQTQIPLPVPPNSPSHPHTQPQPQPHPQPQMPPHGGPVKNLFHGNFEQGGSQFSPGGHQYGPKASHFVPGMSGGDYCPVQVPSEQVFVVPNTSKAQVPNPGNPSLAVPIHAGRQNVHAHYPQGSPAGPSALNDLDSQSPRNNLDTPPIPPRPVGLSSVTRPNVIGEGVGTLGPGTVGGAVGRTNVPTSTVRPKINMDEELAHHLAEFIPPAQTREQILSDEEYARQLQEQFNKAEPPESDRDRELALALQTEEFPSGLPDLAQGEIGLQNTVKDTLKKQEEKKEQEKRDFQLAQELNDLGGGEPHQLNDLNS